MAFDRNHMIADWEAARIRCESETEFARRPDLKSVTIHEVQYGDVERVRGTGRATCRVCGQKIAKGEDALRFHWDFTGCGSWTSVRSQIHAGDCTA